jgi:hypothetical protein
MLLGKLGALCFRGTIIYISRAQLKESCFVRCHKSHKIGGPAQWWKIQGVQNFQGTNFQCICHLTGFQNGLHTLETNKALHDKEHLSHTQSSNQCDIE